MTTPIRLSAQTPRDPAILSQFDLGLMLRVYSILAWLAIVMGGLMAPVALIVFMVNIFSETGNNLGISVALLGCTAFYLGVGLWGRNKIKRRRTARERALVHGKICPARLISSRPTVGISAVMMRADTLLSLDVQLPDGRVVRHSVRTPDPGVAQRLEDRGSVHALFDPDSGACLFPFELGREIAIAEADHS